MSEEDVEQTASPVSETVSHPGDVYLIGVDRMEDLETLSTIAEELGISHKQLSEWAREGRREKNGFPPPMMTMGRYNLYDKMQVKGWFRLWSKISRQMKNSLNQDNDNDNDL